MIADLTIAEFAFLDRLVERGGARVIADDPGYIRTDSQRIAREGCAQKRLAVWTEGEGWSLTDAGRAAWQAWPRSITA